MKIDFIGTCSGTEPLEGFRHTSIAITYKDRLFWFDAGENCSYSAHVRHGLDLLASRAIFISHTHMDHIGGLPNLLWNIRKINGLPATASRFTGKTLDIFVPGKRLMPAIRKMLSCTESGFAINFEIREKNVHDGLIFDENGFKVTAHHNKHLPKSQGKWQSFSFKIECGKRKIVYSGDIRDISEIEEISKGAELVLVETGHHIPENICRYFRDIGFTGKLGFLHHGRSILENFKNELEKARGILGKNVFFARDGETYR